PPPLLLHLLAPLDVEAIGGGGEYDLSTDAAGERAEECRGVEVARVIRDVDGGPTEIGEVLPPLHVERRTRTFQGPRVDLAAETTANDAGPDCGLPSVGPRILARLAEEPKKQVLGHGQHPEPCRPGPE